MRWTAATALAAFCIAACAPRADNAIEVPVSAETEPVATSDDAADDPAIWYNAEAPERSIILGTDKNAGLYLYDLSGAVLQFLPAGELNNVDLREAPSGAGAIAAASNRSDDTITLFALENESARMIGAFPSPLAEPYGLCMGAHEDALLVFVAYKTGDVIGFRLVGEAGGEEIGRLKVSGQTEGCVFDDETGTLYFGEEERGVWRSDYADGVFSEPALIDEVGAGSGIVADIEGLAIYKTGPGQGFLIASSQGNNSYALYSRAAPNRFLGRFRLVGAGDIDGAEETDGIEAISHPLGEAYPKGVLVVQDGFNKPDGSAQNFKIVDWRNIENAFNADAAGDAAERSEH